jgi:hypothetical protein
MTPHLRRHIPVEPTEEEAEAMRAIFERLSAEAGKAVGEPLVPEPGAPQ